MKKFIMDTHTHTIASGHAYGTVMEMADAASKAGLELLGITEHAPSLEGSCSEMYFRNFKVIPDYLCGVRILMGCELNIMDYKGSIDLAEKTLKKLPYTIASLHGICLTPGSRKENTEAILGALENPYVTIIGHPDDGRFPTDFEEMVKGAKRCGKLIEINNSSLRPCSRENTEENLKEILRYCEKYDQEVIVNTDSHFPVHVGVFDEARLLISECQFPEDLIINTDKERFKKYLPEHWTLGL